VTTKVVNPAAVATGGITITMHAFFAQLGTALCHFAVKAVLALWGLAAREDELLQCTDSRRCVPGLPCVPTSSSTNSARPRQHSWRPSVLSGTAPRLQAPARATSRPHQRLCGSTCRNASHDARAWGGVQPAAGVPQ
jgi:hypothetical protein